MSLHSYFSRLGKWILFAMCLELISLWEMKDWNIVKQTIKTLNKSLNRIKDNRQ